MNELLIQLRREIIGAWRFRWWALTTAWLVCVIGWFSIYSMHDTYEAQATFHVETLSRLDRVMDGVRLKDDSTQQINLVRNVMLGRPMLEQVAEATDLHLRVTTEAQKQALLDRLQKNITLIGDSNPRNPSQGIYNISYSDVDRETAVTVVEALLDSFIEDVTQGDQTGSEETIEFLTSETEKYELQLRQREQALADFKREHVGLLPGDATGGYFERLQAEMDSVKLLQSDYRTVSSRKVALEGQLRGESPVIDAAPGSTGPAIDEPTTDLERRIVELDAELDSLLLRFTERHPDVVSTREQLDRLYQRRQTELAGMAVDGGQNVISDNPVYQQLQISLNEVEVELAGIDSQIKEHQAKITDLRSKVNEVPQIEARLADLTRDYDQVKSTYDKLRALLEQENIALNQKKWDVVDVRLIDPPFAPADPTSPERVALLAMVLGGSLIVGAAIAALVHLLKPVVFDARKLEEVIGLPVLGSVRMTWLNRNLAQRRAELGSFLAASAFLFLAFGVVVLARNPAGELVRNLIG